MAAITRLVGVYDADGTLRGEVAYWIGARLGRRHCALCDITHTPWRERADWTSCRDGLPVPFVTVHRDEVPAPVGALGQPPPYVAAETDAGAVTIVLDAPAVEACGADPEALMAALEAAAERMGLTWTSPAARPPPPA
jgi:hypothetical protein